MFFVVDVVVVVVVIGVVVIGVVVIGVVVIGVVGVKSSIRQTASFSSSLLSSMFMITCNCCCVFLIFFAGGSLWNVFVVFPLITLDSHKFRFGLKLTGSLVCSHASSAHFLRQQTDDTICFYLVSVINV